MCFLKYMLSYFHDPDEPCIDVHIVDSSNVLAMMKARIKHRSGTTVLYLWPWYTVSVLLVNSKVLGGRSTPSRVSAAHKHLYSHTHAFTDSTGPCCCWRTSLLISVPQVLGEGWVAKVE